MRMARVKGEFGAFKSEYVFWGPNIQLGMMSMPPLFRMPFSVEAQIHVPEQGGSGVIVAAGSYFGGWSFYLQDGKPVAYAAASPLPLPGMQSRVEAPTALSAGTHNLLFDFDMAGEGGAMTISVDGEQVAKGQIDKRPIRLAGSGETLDTGRDTNVQSLVIMNMRGFLMARLKRSRSMLSPRNVSDNSVLNCIQKIHTTELVLLLIRIARVVERMLLRPQVIILSEEIFDLALRPLVAESRLTGTPHQRDFLCQGNGNSAPN